MPEPASAPMVPAASGGESRALADMVLAALTTEMTGAQGEPLRVSPVAAQPTGDAVAPTGTSVITVDIDGAVHDGGGTSQVGRYRLSVDERRRTVDLHFAVDKYEFRRRCVNVAAVHARFVAALGDAVYADPDAPRCTLRARVDTNHDVWVRFLQWQDGYWPINAAHLQTAVENVGTTMLRQTVWDATGLVERILLIAGADPHLATGAGSWRHLVETSPPATLYAAIDELRSGLARAVFSAMPCWYGQQVVGGAAP